MKERNLYYREIGENYDKYHAHRRTGNNNINGQNINIYTITLIKHFFQV